MLTREEAYSLLRQYLHDDKLIKHCIAVESIMRKLAMRLNEDVELWGLIGLLHDIDYDITNRDLKRHGLEALKILSGKLPQIALEAIAAHNEDNGFVPSIEESKRIAIALRAADHISGLIIATALVMPHRKIDEIKLSTLKRKFKSKDFARNVSREHIRRIEELGIALDEFLQLALEALKSIAKELGL